jgi:hypothetical protein
VEGFGSAKRKSPKWELRRLGLLDATRWNRAGAGRFSRDKKTIIQSFTSISFNVNLQNVLQKKSYIGIIGGFWK